MVPFWFDCFLLSSENNASVYHFCWHYIGCAHVYHSMTRMCRDSIRIRRYCWSRYRLPEPFSSSNIFKWTRDSDFLTLLGPNWRNTCLFLYQDYVKFTYRNASRQNLAHKTFNKGYSRDVPEEGNRVLKNIIDSLDKSVSDAHHPLLGTTRL